jgi:hypothetical protein
MLAVVSAFVQPRWLLHRWAIVGVMIVLWFARELWLALTAQLTIITRLGLRDNFRITAEAQARRRVLASPHGIARQWSVRTTQSCQPTGSSSSPCMSTCMCIESCCAWC